MRFAEDRRPNFSFLNRSAGFRTTGAARRGSPSFGVTDQLPSITVWRFRTGFFFAAAVLALIPESQPDAAGELLRKQRCDAHAARCRPLMIGLHGASGRKVRSDHHYAPSISPERKRQGTVRGSVSRNAVKKALLFAFSFFCDRQKRRSQKICHTG